MEYNEETIRSKYMLVPRTLVFICDEDKYLFIHKKKEDSFGYEKLNGIGGHIEKGEEPYESAMREIFEETGLVVTGLSLAAIVFIEIGINPGILMFVFSAMYKGGYPMSSEEGDLVWIHKDEIPLNQDIIKDVPFLIDVVENHVNGQQPKFIKYLYDQNKELRIVI
jgi:8-oxo-dGTP diphosphatase